jgi:hypothetical protein
MNFHEWTADIIVCRTTLVPPFPMEAIQQMLHEAFDELRAGLKVDPPITASAVIATAARPWRNEAEVT